MDISSITDIVTQYPIATTVTAAASVLTGLVGLTADGNILYAREEQNRSKRISKNESSPSAPPRPYTQKSPQRVKVARIYNYHHYHQSKRRIPIFDDLVDELDANY